MKNAPGPLDLWNAGLHAWCSAVHMQTEAMIRFWAAMGVWSHPPMARELAQAAEAAARRSKKPANPRSKSPKAGEGRKAAATAKKGPKAPTSRAVLH